MNQVANAKLQDAMPTDRSSGPSNPQDVESLLGTWRNTNSATKGIAMAVITRKSADVVLRVFGAGENEPYDWGETNVTDFFAAGIGSQQAISFTAGYDFGFLETEIQTNLAKGLLIISTVNTFKDDSPRSDYFAREYFYKEPHSA